MKVDYELKRHTKTMTTRKFYERFSNFDLIQGYCRECPRYGTNYSCSPLDLDIEEFFNSYDYIDIIVSQLFFKPEDYERKYTKEVFDQVINDTLVKERKKVVKEVLEREKTYAKAQALTGPCNHCVKNCREVYDECIHPEIRRYSLASLGIHTSKVLKDLFDIDLIKIEKELPKYLNNVTTILYCED